MESKINSKTMTIYNSSLIYKLGLECMENKNRYLEIITVA